MAMIFIQQQIRQILFFLDNAVYSLISNVYELILYLANVNLVNNNSVLTGLISRIYLILGIFMLFKISFSILQYIIDPNAFSDSSKGFGKLVTNTMVALVLLVAVPFIFDELYKLQNVIISSNAIPNLVLGTHLDDNSENADDFNMNQQQMSSMAKDIEFAIFGAFATVNTGDKGFSSCKPTNEHPSANVVGSADMVESGCYDAMEGEMVEELNKHGGKLSDFFKYAKENSVITGETCPDGICDDRKFSSYASLLWWAKSEEFVINYFPFVPTVIGGYLLLLLVSFAVDIAIRVFKLMFLQAVAPISIISYIDPKESASNSKLYKWAMEVLKTFLSLFLRLAVIFLIVQLVNMITSQIFLPLDASGKGIYNEGIAPSPTMHIFVYIFLIVGLFAFAKQVPKMIENLFPGMGGDLSLNPLKSIGENGLATGLIGGVVGAGAASIASGATALAQGKGFLGATKSGVAGAISGTARGIKGGIKGQGIGNAAKAGLRAGGISARNKQMKGELGIDYLRHPIKSAQKGAIKGISRVSDKIGGPTPGQVLSGRAAQYEKVTTSGENYKKKIEENSASSKAVASNGRSYQANFTSLNEEKSRIQRQFWEGKITEQQRADQTKAANDQIDALQNEYRNAALEDSLKDSSGRAIHDYDLQNAHDTFNSSLSDVYSKSELQKLQLDSIDSISDIKEGIRVSKDEAARRKNTDMYRTSAQVGETIENLHKEAFYETHNKS